MVRRANARRARADNGGVRNDGWIALVLVVSWGTVARAMVVAAQKLPPTCRGCGRRLERRYLGEPVCRRG